MESMLAGWSLWRERANEREIGRVIAMSVLGGMSRFSSWTSTASRW
jgi:hypothetical protein